ncbi:Histone-fold [Artemisia annua]|uniref:Histone-fold n=1 Tax=Artemisia annua TaxID=35608 RepID=A0A2U1MBY2_ARTAN|nr:Histone-fold [Artemisia annua]
MDPSQNIDKKLNRAHILKSNQQAPNAKNRPSRKKVPFAMLYPVLEPQLDKDSAMQLLGQYARFMVNSISKAEFIQYMRTLVGDRTLYMAVYKVATRPDPLETPLKNTHNKPPYPSQSPATISHSTMKFLEEDDDKTMHAWTHIEEARIEEDNNNKQVTNSLTESQQRLTAATASLAQATNHTPSELFQQWQSSPSEEEIKPQTQEPATVANRIGPSGSETQHPQNHTSRELTRSKEEQSNQHNVHVSQAMNTQKTSDGNPAQNVAQSQLDRDRAVQLQTLYARLRSNTINKEEFVRHVRALVGDHMLKTEIYRLQQGQVPAPARQNTQRASSTLQSSDARALPADQRPRLLERQSDSHGGQASHASNANVSAINYHQQQLQQQHMNLPQPSFPTYGNTGGNFHPSASTNMDKPTPSYKHQSHGLQMRQGPVNPAMATQAMSQHDLNDMKRLHRNSALQQNSGHWQASMHKDQGLISSNPYAKSDSEDQMNDQQHRSQLSIPDGLEHATRGPGSSKHDTFEAMFSRLGSITAQLERQNATPPKKPIVGQKKPLEAPVNPLSKKQKVVGEFADQSIEKLNDVTAVSGVNLRRVNLERPRHRTVITSDVRKQIMSMNQKAREEWEKKQADVEKFQRADEVNKEQDDKMRTKLQLWQHEQL